MSWVRDGEAFPRKHGSLRGADVHYRVCCRALPDTVTGVSFAVILPVAHLRFRVCKRGEDWELMGVSV